MATNAANRGSEMCSSLMVLTSSKWQAHCFRERLIVESWLFRTASEDLVLETKHLPPLETLFQNIECLAVQLVAAGGLLSDHVSFRANAVGGFAADLCSVERGKGSQTPIP